MESQPVPEHLNIYPQPLREKIANDPELISSFTGLQKLEQRKQRLQGLIDREKDETLHETPEQGIELSNEIIQKYQELINSKIKAILREQFKEAQPNITTSDKLRDKLLKFLLKFKDKQPDKEVPPIKGTLKGPFSLLINTVVHGFAKVAESLSKDSSFFDTLTGEQIAKLFMTRFIAGKSMDQAYELTEKYREKGIKSTFALEVEGENDPEQQDKNLQDIVQEVHNISSLANDPDDRNVSVKITAWSGHFNKPENKEKAYNGLKAIVQAAHENNAFIRIDLEEYEYRDTTNELFKKLLTEHPEYENNVGLVIQAYLKDSKEKTEDLLNFAKENNLKLNFRLVKGAYMEKERKLAEAEGRPSPINDTENDTNQNYNNIASLLMQNQTHLQKVAFATMNPKTVNQIIQLQHKYQFPSEMMEFQQLYGMVDPLSYSTANLGYKTRKYSPFGYLYSQVTAYFMRRCHESPSQLEMIERFLTEELTA